MFELELKVDATGVSEEAAVVAGTSVSTTSSVVETEEVGA